MPRFRSSSSRSSRRSLLAALARDTSGNTLALVAASMLPLLAVLGSGLDMGRTYVAQARLQQACDAGVLAARKRLGNATQAYLPDAARTAGQDFFDANFGDGAFGTKDRNFTMQLQKDQSVDGTASVTVPTTVMQVFGYTSQSLEVECKAKLNFTNLDVMFVLDTTGSMDLINPGDTKTRIEVLREVVQGFYDKMEASKVGSARFRYGFVPYSTNVNVGHTLKSAWMVDKWEYHGRESYDTGKVVEYPQNDWQTTNYTGDVTSITPYKSATCPTSTFVPTYGASWVDADGYTNTPVTRKGYQYYCTLDLNDSTQYLITGLYYDDSYISRTKFLGMATAPIYYWRYQPFTFDVSTLKPASANAPMNNGVFATKMGGYYASSPEALNLTYQGCVEERETYEINDYSNVNLNRALDLDIDLVPTAGVAKTQWRPMLHEASFVRAMRTNGSGTFETGKVETYESFFNASWMGTTSCPAPARKLAPMDRNEMETYLEGLYAVGSTYHDIGMIWGGRLLSPTGLFADENKDDPAMPTSRHLIFLTDGQTEPLDLSYGTYGIEPLDKRRWDSKSKFTLTQTVENRFAFACNEVKKRNITVWVIGFGVSLNPIMKTCAGNGRFFEAKDAAQLGKVFGTIAESMGDLRLGK